MTNLAIRNSPKETAAGQLLPLWSCLPSDETRRTVNLETVVLQPNKGGDRQTLRLSDTSDKEIIWQMPEMEKLWRGTQKFPLNALKGEPPEDYLPIFHFIEKNIFRLASAAEGWRDTQFQEAFSAVRRRPQGKTLGACHDAVWQTMAFTSFIWVISYDEFCNILQRLERSARAFKTSSCSSNYVQYAAPLTL
jgi:hypothetical protein